MGIVTRREKPRGWIVGTKGAAGHGNRFVSGIVNTLQQRIGQKRRDKIG